MYILSVWISLCKSTYFCKYIYKVFKNVALEFTFTIFLDTTFIICLMNGAKYNSTSVLNHTSTHTANNSDKKSRVNICRNSSDFVISNNRFIQHIRKSAKTVRWFVILGILILAICSTFATAFLSSYIYEQKLLNDKKASQSVSDCFLGENGCATVQTSVYATNFGLSQRYFAFANPLVGIYAFSILAMMMIALVGISVTLTSVNLSHTQLQHMSFVYNKLWFFLLVGSTIASVMSLWLLYVQFWLLQTTCIYCLWVDGLTILTTICLFGIYRYIRQV
jgi:uncharacterized membrane protein